MTTYDDMPAGRELDALVAEKVMGLEIVYPVTPNVAQEKSVRVRVIGAETKWMGCDVLPCYSTDIAAAWGVVEKLIEDGYGHFVLYWNLGIWYCGVRDVGWCEVAFTAPLAVCYSALKVVG